MKCLQDARSNAVTRVRERGDDHHSDPHGYRERFADSERLPAPRTAVCVWTICADTDEQAERLASSSRMGMSMLRQGRFIPVPPVERALAYLQTRERSSTASGRRAVLGSPETVKAGLERVAGEYGAGEVMLVTITFDHARTAAIVRAGGGGVRPHACALARRRLTRRTMAG